MKVRVTLNGTAPLIMHNVRLANPLDPMAKAMKAISGKRMKTEDDYEQLARIEFEGGLYHDEEVGPYIPAVNVERCLVDGARVTKSGKKIESGLFVIEDRVPVLYQGPRTVEELWEDANFVSVMPVRVGAARVMRTRPIFRDWAVEFEAEIDPGILSADDVATYAEAAGSLKGLGEYRPRYGRFTSEVVAL